jgi:carbonic anhydrase
MEIRLLAGSILAHRPRLWPKTDFALFRSGEAGCEAARRNVPRASKAFVTLSFMVLLAGSAIGSAIASENKLSPLPGAALRQLLDGNARFAANRSEHPRQRPADAPQHPLAIILSCSDSRVPPEIAFDMGVGDLFVVRAAGNTYDRLALQSIEYAVDHLGVKLVVVMGHDHCGAVTAALAAYPDPDTGPMLMNIYPAIRATEHHGGDRLSETINENATLVAGRLAEEPALSERIKRGELKVVAARYNLSTGAVTVLSPK